jgi:hypothetical protein
MKLSTLMRWVGPAAIGGGVFMVFSELAGLPIHIPYLSQDAPTGYAAVGSGLVLLALVLLLVGMLGLYAGRRPGPRVGRVIEYGDARGRYVLIEEEDLARSIPSKGQLEAESVEGLLPGASLRRGVTGGPSGSGTVDSSLCAVCLLPRVPWEEVIAMKARIRVSAGDHLLAYHSTSFQISGCSSPSSPTSAKSSTARLRCVMDSSCLPAACSRSARLLCNAASR